MAETNNVIVLSGKDAQNIRDLGFESGEQIVFEAVGTVIRIGADSVPVEVDSIVVKKMPRDFKDAAARTYVALRQEHSVG